MFVRDAHKILSIFFNKIKEETQEKVIYTSWRVCTGYTRKEKQADCEF
jgi:hypothetical protein